jgi:hypothetical protein
MCPAAARSSYVTFHRGLSASRLGSDIGWCFLHPGSVDFIHSGKVVFRNSTVCASSEAPTPIRKNSCWVHLNAPRMGHKHIWLGTLGTKSHQPLLRLCFHTRASSSTMWRCDFMFLLFGTSWAKDFVGTGVKEPERGLRTVQFVQRRFEKQTSPETSTRVWASYCPLPLLCVTQLKPQYREISLAPVFTSC